MSIRDKRFEHQASPCMFQDKVVRESEGWSIQQLEELRVVLIRQGQPFNPSSRSIPVHL